MISVRNAAGFVRAAVFSLGMLVAIGCGTTYRPIANPVVQPGGDPAQREIVAVVNSNPNANLPASVTFIDVAGDSNVGVMSTGKGLVRAAYDLNNSSLYVPNPGSGIVTDLTLSSISGYASTTVNISLNGSVPKAAFAGSGKLFLLDTPSASKNCPNPSSLGIVDMGTDSLSSDICLGQDLSWVYYASNQTQAFVLDRGGNQIFPMYTPNEQMEAPIVLTSGKAPVWAGPSYTGDYVFVLNHDSSDIAVIDANTRLEAVASVPVGGIGPSYGYMDSKLNRLYVLNQTSKTVTVFDASDPLHLRRIDGTGAGIPTGPAPSRISITAEGDKVFVANTGDNTVTEILASSFASKTLKFSIAGYPDAQVRVTDAAVSKTVATMTKDGPKLFVALVTLDNGGNFDDLGNQTQIFRLKDETMVNTIAAPRQDVSNCEPSVTPAGCGKLLQRSAQIAGPR